MLVNLNNFILNVGGDSGVFSKLFEPSKSVFGNITYIMLEFLGWVSIISVVVSLIVIVVNSDRRKQAAAVFIISVLIAALKFGGTIKEFLNGIGK